MTRTNVRARPIFGVQKRSFYQYARLSVTAMWLFNSARHTFWNALFKGDEKVEAGDVLLSFERVK